jgi:hypothetical protein
MTIEGAIDNRLMTHAGITALIAGRAYAGFGLPQEVTYPAISHGRVAETKLQPMGVNSALTHARWQFSCWDDNYDGVRDLVDQVKDAFDRWKGTVDATVIQDTLRVDGTGGDVFVEPVAERGIHHVPLEYMVHFEE